MGLKNFVLRAAPAALFVVVASAQSQGVKAVKLTGAVVDERGIYVPNVELTLKRNNRVEATSRSGDGGQFEFPGTSPGVVLITAHRLGYRERSMEVNVQSNLDQQTIQIDMATLAADLEKVVVEESSGRLQEFIEHRKASKFGRFFDQNEIRSLNPRYLSELFRSVPGARLEAAAGGGNKLILRGCRPKIWVDGVLAQYAEIDEVILPSEIAGMEVYPSMAGVPAQYMDRENRACGTVIIWSRQT